MSVDRRVQFDFEIEFANGGGLQGQEFRLDIAGETIADEQLADAIVRDLRLLMVGTVRILNKKIISERHKRSGAILSDESSSEPVLVELSHTIEHGMITYKGLPAPLICDFLSREDSRAIYAEDTTFQIGKIEMASNTGTYLDSPFHRYADGHDLSELKLAQFANLDGVLVRVEGQQGRAIDRDAFLPYDVRGKAVLVHTGWSRNWRQESYFEGHPFLTEAAAVYLRDSGATLVGIDSLNIDDTGDLRRPVHTTLLGAQIPIVEHMCNLEALPATGFVFTAAPPKVKGMGTFPVRAFAILSKA